MPQDMRKNNKVDDQMNKIVQQQIKKLNKI